MKRLLKNRLPALLLCVAGSMVTCVAAGALESGWSLTAANYHFCLGVGAILGAGGSSFVTCEMAENHLGWARLTLRSLGIVLVIGFIFYEWLGIAAAC